MILNIYNKTHDLKYWKAKQLDKNWQKEIKEKKNMHDCNLLKKQVSVEYDFRHYRYITKHMTESNEKQTNDENR